MNLVEINLSQKMNQMNKNNISNIDIARLAKQEGYIDGITTQPSRNNITGGGGNDGGDVLSRIINLEIKAELIEQFLRNTNSTLSSMNSNLDSHFNSLELRLNETGKRLDSSEKLLSEKIENTSKLTEANVRTFIAEAKLSVILVIPTIIGAAFTLYKIFSNK
ncbi:Uncharacterised protein [Raoultella ornithinolytica]|nr:Uncharacterised protein [Raoultella ornithinolytica]STR71920.1 Uncharacterised protein [Raoultella ornithinolytica]